VKFKSRISILGDGPDGNRGGYSFRFDSMNRSERLNTVWRVTALAPFVFMFLTNDDMILGGSVGWAGNPELPGIGGH
jgi:hypothetical protein